MESPASTVRRRAWINSSRQWLTLEDPDPEAQPFRLPSPSLVDDDVFSDSQTDSPRCFSGKIESWLLGCGLESSLENVYQLSFDNALKAGNFHDDLSLGADACALSGGPMTPGADFTNHPSVKQRRSRLTSSTPRQQLCMPSLSLGQSMASSCPSSSTCKTSSSVSEVLKLCSEDAEETLYELGFGSDEPQVTVRIPPRFFTFPSQAQGINFRLFLDSQLRRIREEDPSLSLASRFRQVQVLTAMANAFYSLYSHVSRTPVQKLATPEFNFSPVEKIERFRSNIRSEPRSPVERLKDTVSKMCLYTGSPRGSDSTSPQMSPRKRQSLPDVVDVMLEKIKPGVNKKLDLEEPDDRNSTMDVMLDSDGDKSRKSCQEEQTEQMVWNTVKAVQDGEHTDKTDTCENSVNLGDTDSKTHSTRTSLASSLSGESVIEVGRQFVSFPSELKSDSSQRTADLKPVAKVSYDLICPQIVENVHQAPFSCQYILGTKTNTLPLISSETESADTACPILHRNHETQTGVSAPYEESCFGSADVSPLGTKTHVDTSQTHPLLAANCRSTLHCITVTIEGKDISSSSLNTLDSSHTSTLPPAQTCEESTGDRKSQYLNPLTHHSQGHNSSNLQQVNSFELEEMHSAGEDDVGQQEHGRTAASPLSTKHPFKGAVARGDSVQSDSSGYAEEEVSPSPRIND